jgi:hypothetical protein
LVCAPVFGVVAQGGSGSVGATVSVQHDSASREAQRSSLSEAVAEDVARVYNASSTQRLRRNSSVPVTQTITGDAAVLGEGAITIAGHITGRFVAINADVVFEAGGQIDGGLLVVGGEVRGRERSSVGGELAIYKDGLRYRMDGDRLVPMGAIRRPFRRFAHDDWSANTNISISGGTYNRVEGWPVSLGAYFHRRTDRLYTKVDLFGIIRSSEGFDWNSNNVGHFVRVEERTGPYRGVGVGATLFDVVNPVEDWHLKESESGLAAFLIHRDYRDYFVRHGGSLYATAFSGSEANLTVSFRDEAWQSRAENDPWTLFRGGESWRPNPLLGDGRMHVVDAKLAMDTRNDQENPWSGWYGQLSVERGLGRLGVAGSLAAPASAQYTRGFLDLRRYNHVSPQVQLNLRVVWGGQLSDDSMPMQRRLSVGGPGTLPGFDFRHDYGGTDVGDCHTGAQLPGQPAMCGRVALAQVEFRSPIGLDLFGSEDRDSSDWRDIAWHPFAQWVLFADAGRGWQIGTPSGDLRYSKSTWLPPLGTFRTDLGGGLDLGGLGFFVAKAISQSKEPMNFFVRLRHRF